MKKIAFILLIGLTGMSGQSISRVDFEVLPGNLIEVSYVIFDSEATAVYSIDLYASLDGGYAFPIHARSVTGDVGHRVVGSGRKSILWKVLEDMPVLVSDNLVLKVVGRTRPTVGGFFLSLVAGNRFTKRMSNGITLYGGSGNYALLDGGAFGAMLDDGSLIPNNDGRIGLRITSVPFVYRFNALYRNWNLDFTVQDEQRLKYLSFGDRRYSGEDVLLLHYVGFSFSVAYTPLPVFGVFLPQVGGGIGYHQFRMGNSKGSVTSSLNNPGLFAEAGMQINLLRWIKLNVGGRQYFLTPYANFTEGFLEIGLHIPSN